MMRTIQLKIHDDVYDRLIWLLNKFGPDEVEIIAQADTANPTESDDVKKGQSQYDEIERNLEIALRKYKGIK